jgi:hypothetical protein
MAFLRPNILIPVTLYWGVVGAAGKASTQLATMPVDGLSLCIGELLGLLARLLLSLLLCLSMAGPSTSRLGYRMRMTPSRR